MTVFSITLGMFLRSVQRQKHAIALIRRNGGSVEYDYQYPNGTYGRDDYDYLATSSVPRWLLDLFDDDFFHDVVVVKIQREYDYGRQNPDADDVVLSRISGLTKLRRLELTHCGITDHGMRHLENFPLLESLEVSYSSITDDSIPYIAGLKSLRQLDLGHTRVGGRGFHRLADLEHLEELGLTLTPIRDEALVKIMDMHQLRYVSIWRCKYLTLETINAFEQAVPQCSIFLKAGIYAEE